MLLNSDNTATDALLKLAGGPEKVQAAIKAFGIDGLRVDRYERDLQPQALGLEPDPAFGDPVALDAAFDALGEAKQKEALARYLRDPRDTASPRAHRHPHRQVGRRPSDPAALCHDRARPHAPHQDRRRSPERRHDPGLDFRPPRRHQPHDPRHHRRSSTTRASPPTRTAPRSPSPSSSKARRCRPPNSPAFTAPPPAPCCRRGVRRGNRTALKRPPARTLRSWHMDSRQWEDYRPRPSDVVIATYPKCGTTWMQRIVSLLIFQSPDPRPMTDISPWIDARFVVQGGKRCSTLIEAQSHRRFLKSHLPFDALPFYEGVSYIHVARDGLDAFMSWHNHQLRYQASRTARRGGRGRRNDRRPYPRPVADPARFLPRLDGPAREWRRKPTSTASSFFDTERTYWDARREPNVLLGPLQRPRREPRPRDAPHRGFPGYRNAGSLWPDLVDAATFDTMKRDGGALMPLRQRRLRRRPRRLHL